MNNAWIVVPVISNSIDLTLFVSNLSGGYVAPETYRNERFNTETMQIEVQHLPHPYAGQTGPNFAGRIIFLNKVSGYTQYDGVIHLEDFSDINIYRYWNTGFEHAVANGADSVILTNGIFDFDPFQLKDGYDKFVDSNKQVINMSDGALLLVSASSTLRADEQFQIWFGDNDLYRRAEEVIEWSRPEYARVDYLVNHVQDETFQEIVASDEAKYNLKWN